MPIVCFGLGTWQVRRLQWKLDMIDQLEEKLNQDTVRLPARIECVLSVSRRGWRSLTACGACSPAAIPEFAYRKVFVEGTLDTDHEILLGPRTAHGELGYNVITPLVRGEGQDTILVNRGFVKRVKKDINERPESVVSFLRWREGWELMGVDCRQIKTPVEIVGMLRDQDRSNSFTPENNAEKDEWIFANIEQMAKHVGAEPVLVDEIFSPSRFRRTRLPLLT